MEQLTSPLKGVIYVYKCVKKIKKGMIIISKKIMDDGIGKVIVPLPEENELHLFGLYINGMKIDEGYFSSEKNALEKVEEVYKCQDFKVKNLDIDYYLELSKMYRKRIKGLKRTFKGTHLVLDFTKWFRSKTPNCYYTYLGFSYKGVDWIYREDASGEWIDKV